MKNPESSRHEEIASEEIVKSTEATPETVETAPDKKVKRTRARKEKPAEEVEKIEELSTSIKVQKIMAEKPKGDEPFSSEPVPDVALSRQQHHDKPWWKKAMVLLGFTGVMASAHAGETRGTSDTTAKEQIPAAKEISVSKPAESTPIQLDQKKLEQAGIVRIDPVESKDTTKQVYLISLKEYKSYDDILNAIKKAGFEPSSYETMVDVAEHNGEIIKKSRNLMSLKYVTNKLGNMSAPTITYDSKRAALHPEARELNAGIDSEYEQYRFVVEVEKPKTANYEDGLAKK